MRLMIAVLVVLGCVCMPLVASAGKPEESRKPDKVLIAHLADEITTETEDVVDGVPVLVVTTTKYYVVIEISSKALPAHEAHGDIDPEGREKGERFEVETEEIVTPGDE